MSALDIIERTIAQTRLVDPLDSGHFVSFEGVGLVKQERRIMNREDSLKGTNGHIAEILLLCKLREETL